MQVQCKQCLAVAVLDPGQDPHAVTWCACCPRGHHHGTEAAACTPEENHPGQPCWNPPSLPVRPDGCRVCRPVVHLPVAGDLVFTPSGVR